MAAKKGKVLFTVDITDKDLESCVNWITESMYDRIIDIIGDTEELYYCYDSKEANKKAEALINKEISTISMDTVASHKDFPKFKKSFVKAMIVNANDFFGDYDVDDVLQDMSIDFSEQLVTRLTPQLKEIADVQKNRNAADEKKQREMEERKQLTILIKKYGVPKE